MQGLDAGHALQDEGARRVARAGPLEHRVHDALAKYRNVRGLGREWFRVELEEVLRAIAFAMSDKTSCGRIIAKDADRPREGSVSSR